MTNRPHSKSTDETPQIADALSWLADHGDALAAYARRRVRDERAAEDLVQETFLAAVKASDRFEGRSSPRTWLIGILRRKIVDHYRRTGKRDVDSLIDDAQEASLKRWFSDRGTWHMTLTRWPTDPAASVEREEFWRVFEECLAALPGTLAGAFMLREIDQLDVEGACDVLGVSANNLGVRLHRARMALRECLSSRWFDGGGS